MRKELPDLKTRQKAYQRKSRTKHRDAIRAYQAAYYLKHRDAIRERKRKRPTQHQKVTQPAHSAVGAS